MIKEVNIQIDNVEKYNEQINEINSFLAQKQIDIQNEEKNIQSKIDEVKIELKSMANIQKRKQYDDICKMYIANKQLKDKLEAEKNEKSKLFEKVESEYVNKYFECINNNFKKLSSRDFEIFKSISRKGKISTYEIKIKYKGIEINSSDIKFCMSESDRRALGFSIFLAKLDLMPDEVISKQIIIMDDPFTSFDDNRLNSSNEIIRRLYERSEQVIIVTHYKAHISTLCKRNSEMDKKIFAIKHLNLKSMLEEYSDEVYIDNEYIKSIKKANKFINGHISDYDISDLRKLLETNINERFAYHLIGHNKMSLSEKIKFLKENGIISEDLFNEYDAKREFSNLEHHDWFDMSNADKVNTVQQFLDTVSK